LLVEPDHPCADRLALSSSTGARIERQLGLQKIEVVVADPQTPESPVLRSARRDGVPV
jgi:hypothetical protein